MNSILKKDSSIEYLKKSEKLGIKLGLSRMKRLLELLDNPQSANRYIQIAGTNGKGSTLSYMESILIELDFKVGAYTSPAVDSTLEQYRINRNRIKEEDYCRIFDLVCETSKKMEDMPTRFELETAVAFVYFKEQKCDYVLLETGLGGELDATNVVDTTVLSVITSVSEDHLHVIGDNIYEIAKTKAGIIKVNVPVCYIDKRNDVSQVISQVANEKNADMYSVKPEDVDFVKLENRRLYFDFGERKNLALSMLGMCQLENASLAVRSIEVLLSSLSVDQLNKAVREGLLCTKWQWRFEIISETPLVILDGAHNPDAAVCLRDSLEKLLPDYSLIYVTGMFNDKDYKKVVSIMAPLAKKVFTVPTTAVGRELSAEELADEYNAFLNNWSLAKASADVSEAIANTKKYFSTIDDEKKALIVFGSLSFLKSFKDEWNSYE